MTDTVQPSELARTRRGIARLWFAFLAGPVAWLLNLEIGYSLVRVACTEQNMLPIHVATVVLLLLALAGAWVGWVDWRTTGGGWPGEEGGSVSRARFMAAMGVLTGVFFALVIVAQWVPNFILPPCAGI